MRWILHDCLLHPWDERLQNPINLNQNNHPVSIYISFSNTNIPLPLSYDATQIRKKSSNATKAPQRNLYPRETPVKGRNGSKIYSSTSDWQRVVDRAKYLKKIQMKCGNQGDLISYQIMHKEIESQPITLLPSLTL